VKNIMVDNIERVLERGEKIELLVDKTDNLRFQVGPCWRFDKACQGFKHKDNMLLLTRRFGMATCACLNFSAAQTATLRATTNSIALLELV